MSTVPRKTLVLERIKSNSYGVFSRLKDGPDTLAVTLEHAYGDKPTAKLLPGMYKCVRGKHRLRADGPVFETFEITGVKGHWGILFHVGNYNKDSDGCVLVGHSITTLKDGTEMITDSRKAFKLFMDYLEGIDEFVLEVKQN